MKFEFQVNEPVRRKNAFCGNQFVILCLILSILVLLALSSVLVAILLQNLPSDDGNRGTRKVPFNSSTSKICNTKDCTVTAAILIEAMDLSVDPCEDFYEFACGSYIATNPAPDEGKKVSVFFEYKDYFTRQLRDIIEDTDENITSNVMLRSKQAYHACLNASYNGQEELNAFKKFVSHDLGGWPFAEGESWQSNVSIEVFIGKIQRLGFKIPFAAFDIEVDNFDPEKNIISLRPTSQPTSAISEALKFFGAKSNIVKDAHVQKIAKAFYTLLIDIAKLLGNKEAENEENNVKEILTMYYEVSQINAISSEDEEEDSSNKSTEKNNSYEDESESADDYEDTMNMTEFSLTLKEMNDIAEGKVDWLKILNTMFKGVYEFNENDYINADYAYVAAVSELLSNKTHREVANYLVWFIISQVLDHAGPNVGRIYNKFLSYVDELYRRPFRWVTCTEWIQTAYPFVITRIFVDEFVDEHGKKMVEEMIHLVQRAYKTMIKQSSWLDKETKNRALRKANALKSYVGYPDLIFDEQKLEKFYEFVPEVNKVHFQNFIEMKLNYTRAKLKTYGNPSTLDNWDMNPMTINAQYVPWSNSIWFPTGILQLPFFDETRPAAVNFGMIGSIIGHEIGHGFDSTGKDYDEIGRFKEWWTEDTLQKYESKMECFVDQYDEFCPFHVDKKANESAICVNGTNTLDENIADNTGLRAAYKAYEMWVKKHGKELRLPGLDEFSLKQIFFISYAYTWCENVADKNWLTVYKNDEHSPGRFRVLGALANSEEFNEVFGCPVGSMNRGIKKCKIW